MNKKNLCEEKKTKKNRSFYLHADDVNQRRQRALTSRSNTHSASIGVHNGKRKVRFSSSHLSILYIYSNDSFIDEKNFSLQD
jgi:hypothetical protein